MNGVPAARASHDLLHAKFMCVLHSAKEFNVAK